MKAHLEYARYQWELSDQANIDEAIQNLKAAGLDYSPAFLRLCLKRGLDTKELIEEAVNQQPQLYHDPFLLYDMEKAVNRINQAIIEGEHIVIYGDYDADGITSTLILYETLDMLGADVSYYLPHRVTDGYGPNLDRYKQLIEERQAKLILTCDNGIVGYDAIDYAMGQDVDVIVSDHHEIQETLPNAYAIIHPMHPQGKYPFGDLAGAGVALKIASALLDEIPTEALELAAIGTVADLVSLTDENRTIVLSGLQLMKDTQRIGLRLLLEENKVNLETLDEQTIGFVIAPRLNAVGRLDEPSPGLELLRTFDETEAREILAHIEEVNQERRSIVERMTSDVMSRIESMAELPDIIIESDSHWPAGVLGIAASRVSDRFNRPTLLFQYNEETQEYKGSGRSVDGVNLFEWIYEHRDLTLHFGGHNQAAGLTITTENWETFKANMIESGKKYHEQIIQPSTLSIDLLLKGSEITLDFIEELSLLSPYGTDNPQPLVLLNDYTLQEIRLIGSDKSHVKLKLVDPTVSMPSLDVVGFSMAEQFKEFTVPMTVSCVGRLELNEWNGRVTPQLLMEDAGVKRVAKQPLSSADQSKIDTQISSSTTIDSQWFDYRNQPFNTDLYQLDDAVYLVQHSALYNYCIKHIQSSSQTYHYKDLDEIRFKSEMINKNRLVIVEPPSQLEILYHFVQETNFNQIYLASYVQESKYKAGLPTRQEAGMVYRWMMNQPAFHIRNELERLAQTFNIPEVKLKQIFLMFYEAEFVRIDEGYVEVDTNRQHQTVDLEQLPAFLAFKEAMKAEELLNFQPINKIKNILRG